MTSSIDGSWHLCFSTATKNRSFQHIPVREDFVVALAAGRVALESVVGPFQFHIKGEVASWQESSRQMDFQFKQVDILLLGNKVRGGDGELARVLAAAAAVWALAGPLQVARSVAPCRCCCPKLVLWLSDLASSRMACVAPQIWTVNPSTKPKTYTWYYVSDTLAAARTSAGGLSLLVKQ